MVQFPDFPQAFSSIECQALINTVNIYLAERWKLKKGILGLVVIVPPIKQSILESNT